MLACGSPFLTTAEKVLWRGSSVVLLLSGFLLVLSKCMCNDGGFLCLLVGGTVYALLMLLAVFYVVARVCLVVECFAELGHKPQQVFEIPRWTAYWPHIT